MGSSAWLPGDGGLPLPLLNGSDVLQQPVDLSKVSDLYIEQATDFITTQAAAKKPFVLYMAHSHVHVPDFTSTKFCNSSIRGTCFVLSLPKDIQISLNYCWPDTNQNLVIMSLFSNHGKFATYAASKAIDHSSPHLFL